MITFSYKSWHYWLATNFAHYRPNDTGQMNICSYMRSVIGGLMAFVFVSVFCTGVAFALVSGLYHFLGYIFGYIHRSATIYEGVGMVLLLIGLVVVSAFYIRDTYDKWQQNRRPAAKSPGFIKTAYRSWKEKTCTLIEFKD